MLRWLTVLKNISLYFAIAYLLLVGGQYYGLVVYQINFFNRFNDRRRDYLIVFVSRSGTGFAQTPLILQFDRACRLCGERVFLYRSESECGGSVLGDGVGRCVLDHGRWIV